jgi:hypothetical protein
MSSVEQPTPLIAQGREVVDELVILFTQCEQIGEGVLALLSPPQAVVAVAEQS